MQNKGRVLRMSIFWLLAIGWIAVLFFFSGQTAVESSALSGWVVLGESMTGRELFGGLLMFGAVLLAQLPMPSLCRKSVRG